MSQFIKFYFTSSMLNMFWTSIRPSSGACDFSIVSPHWLCVLVSMCVGVSMWLVGVVSVWQASAPVQIVGDAGWAQGYRKEKMTRPHLSLNPRPSSTWRVATPTTLPRAPFYDNYGIIKIFFLWFTLTVPSVRQNS